MSQRFIPTTVVGSYPQPAWLVDHDLLLTRTPPRNRWPEIWRPPTEILQAAQDDATRLAIDDLTRAGIDIVGDGEIRRESYGNLFANSLDGIDKDKPGTAISRLGKPDPVPRVVGPIGRGHPVHVHDVEFLRAHTDRQIKMTLPGPFTLSQQAADEHYRDEVALAMAYADAVNAEIEDLFAAGADVVQLDEPFLQARIDKAQAFGVAAIDRALDGATGTTAVHLCMGYAALIKDKPAAYSFLTELNACAADQISIEAAEPGIDLDVLRALPDKAIILGVLDLADPAIETAETVAGRIRQALEVLPPERLIAAPDCGMKYMPRDVAIGKLKAMVAGAAIVRRELG